MVLQTELGCGLLVCLFSVSSLSLEKHQQSICTDRRPMSLWNVTGHSPGCKGPPGDLGVLSAVVCRLVVDTTVQQWASLYGWWLTDRHSWSTG